MDMSMQLVFLGEVLDGFQSDEVKRQLGQLLKLDDARVDRLFSGRRTVLKRSIEPADAHRYAAQLAQIGARIRIEPSDTPGAGSLSSGQAALQSAPSVPFAVAPRALAPGSTAENAPAGKGIGFSGRIGRLNYAIEGTLVAIVAALLLIFVLAWPARPVSAMAANLHSAEARAAFEDEYAAAPPYKVFAASVGGAWGWQGGAASLEAAFNEAIANCEARREPHMPPCAPVNIDGQWATREGG